MDKIMTFLHKKYAIEYPIMVDTVTFTIIDGDCSLSLRESLDNRHILFGTVNFLNTLYLVHNILSPEEMSFCIQGDTGVKVARDIILRKFGVLSLHHRALVSAIQEHNFSWILRVTGDSYLTIHYIDVLDEVAESTFEMANCLIRINVQETKLNEFRTLMRKFGVKVVNEQTRTLY